MKSEKNFYGYVQLITFCMLLFIAFLPKTAKAADAGGTTTCTALCSIPCATCPTMIEQVHQSIRQKVTKDFKDYRDWFVKDYFLKHVLPGMMLMTQQLTTVSLQQVFIIGTFFDAKHQLETQRLFQTLVAKAHKDYHPSEGMCEIGTAVRSLASSERKSDLTQVAFANRMMQRQLLSVNTLSGRGATSDKESRLKQFREVYCDPMDNAGQLGFLCGAGGNPLQRNLDVDYTNSLENKLTLDLDFTGLTTPEDKYDEQNIFALGANLFGHELLNVLPQRLLANPDNTPRVLANFYLKQRSVIAKRSVAQNSFSAIASMRASGGGENAAFLKSFIEQLGIGEDEIIDYIGDNPSYFAQMEILTKKIYQNPKFYADLYDKPVNIERKGAALQAIGLMQDRDIYNSLIRSEAVLATLLESLIYKEHDRISRDLSTIQKEDEKRKQ